MEFEKVIFGRRSVRKFSDKSVEREKINKIIEAAIYAPSATNKQAWKFIIVDDKSKKECICKTNGSVVKVGADIIYNAPVGILVLYRNDVSKNYRLYKDTIQSAAAAIENMLLMAYELGLGGCWLCKLPLPKYLREIFNIPKTYDIIAYVALGYPHGDVDSHTLRHFEGDKEFANRRTRRYSVEDVSSYNIFEEKKECKEIYKYVSLVCILQKWQLSLKRGREGIAYKCLRLLLKALGEKWA